MSQRSERRARLRNAARQDSTPDVRDERFPNVLALRRLVLGVGLLLAAVQLLAYGYALVYPYSMNYTEGFVLDHTLRLSRGESLWGDFTARPYFPTVYPPLMPALLASILRVTGPSLLPGRLLSLATYVGFAAVLGRAVARRRGAFAGWLLAGVVLASPLFHPWAALNKADLIALYFGAVGLVVVWERSGWRSDLWAGLAFGAAVWSKQNAFAALLAALVVRARESPRSALRLGVVVAALVLVPGLILQHATGGWFLRHSVATHFTTWHLERVAGFWGQAALLHPVVLGAGVAALVQCARRLALALPPVYALATVALSFAAGKPGSDTDYVMEPMAALALLAVTELEPGRLWATRGRRAALALAVVVQAALFVPGNVLHLRLAHASRGAMRLASERVARTPGDVLSDDAALLGLQGKRVWLEPFIMTQLARGGAWDERPLLEELRARRFTLLVLQVEPRRLLLERYTPRQLEAAFRNYRPAGTFRSMGYTYAFLEPRPLGEFAPVPQR